VYIFFDTTPPFSFIIDIGANINPLNNKKNRNNILIKAKKNHFE
jgi:hypothetical protein